MPAAAAGPTPTERQRRLAFALAAVPLLLLAARFWFVCDDAFISFRYVDHLVAGHGLVWNVGERPVEGYSHPLWIAWLATLHGVGVPPEIAAPWTALACGLLLLWVVTGAIAERVGGGLPLFAGALLIGASPIAAAWSTSGLETMAAALCATLLPLSFYPARVPGERAPRGAVLGALALALAWLRPEGAMVAAGWLALFFLHARTHGAGASSARRAVAVAALVLVLGVLATTVFRLVYFGDWVPNTVRAKGGFAWFRIERGLRYLLGLALTFPGLAVAALLGCWRLRADAEPAASSGVARLGSFGIASALYACGVLAYVVWVGGDFMTMGRFVVPLLPFTALWFASGLAALRMRGRSALAATLAALAIAASVPPAFDVHLTPAAWRLEGHYGRPAGQPTSEYRAWVQQHDGPLVDTALAAALREHTRPGESLIRAAIGTVGYRTELRVLDSFALVTRKPPQDHMVVPEHQAGHDRMLPWPVFLDDRPDYVAAHLGPRGGDVVYGLLQTPFAISPLADLVEVLRFPVERRDAAGRELELRLLAFRRWELATDRLPNLLACVRGLAPDDPASAAELERRADAARTALAADDAALRELLAAGRIGHHGAAPLQFSCAAEGSPRTFGFGVWVTVQSAQNAMHRAPRGKFLYALALAGEPTINGRAPGWQTLPPAPMHGDVVANGIALLVHFLPAGALF